MADTITPEQLTEFFENQLPFNVLLGMKVHLLGEGLAELRIPCAPQLVGDPFRPALHGGVISTIADACGGLSVFTLTTVADRVSTVDLRVDYLRPGRVDVDVFARSKVLRMGNKVAVTDTIVFHQGHEDQPVAKAAAVYNVVRGRSRARREQT